MTIDRPRLIEVAFLLEQASMDSVNEVSVFEAAENQMQNKIRSDIWRD